MLLTSSQLLRMMFWVFFLPKTFAQTQYVIFLMSLFLTLYNIIHFTGFNRLHTSPCSQTEVLLAKAPTVGRHPGARAQAQHLWPLGASPSRCSITARRAKRMKNRPSSGHPSLAGMLSCTSVTSLSLLPGSLTPTGIIH